MLLQTLLSRLQRLIAVICRSTICAGDTEQACCDSGHANQLAWYESTKRTQDLSLWQPCWDPLERSLPEEITALTQGPAPGSHRLQLAALVPTRSSTEASAAAGLRLWHIRKPCNAAGLTAPSGTADPNRAASATRSWNVPYQRRRPLTDMAVSSEGVGARMATGSSDPAAEGQASMSVATPSMSSSRLRERSYKEGQGTKSCLRGNALRRGS